uniref:Oxoglutarate (alpha-ketoglutarate) receptor 1b n=1 Tax=Electrophorus electricus TaxID=8005 RepID=A0A4W4FNL2_ELEEL
MLLLKHLYLPAMYGIISVVGLMGNLTAITVYVVKLRPWKSGSVVMVNLTMADLLYALSLPFLVHFYSTGDWTLCEFMCRFLHSCFHFNMYSSVLFLACFSVFRHEAYWGIWACMAVWVVSLAEITPMLGMITTQMEGTSTMCLDFASNDPEQVWWYSWPLTALGFLLPMVVVC